MSKYVLILIMLNCINCYDIRTDLITICSSNNKSDNLINLCSDIILEPNYYYIVYSFCENMYNKSIIEPEFTSMCIDADKYMSNVNVIVLKEEYWMFFDKVNLIILIVVISCSVIIINIILCMSINLNVNKNIENNHLDVN